MPLTPDQRLEMLAGSPNGCTESALRAHGFRVGLLASSLSDLADHMTHRVRWRN
jgi:hypothetical protein